MATKIEGLEKTLARIKAMPAAAQAQISQALEKGATELVAMQKRLAPVEEGDLRDSIEWHWTGQGDAGQGNDSAYRQSAKGAAHLAVTITAGGAPKSGHAGWVEFSTAAAPGHAATPAQPFFFPAYRALQKRIRSRIARAMGKAVRGQVGQ